MIQYNISSFPSRGFPMTARRRPTWLHPAALAASILLPGAAAAEPPEVIASIKPIHSLAAAVMAGIDAPELLVQGPASPPRDRKGVGSGKSVSGRCSSRCGRYH